MLHRRLAALAAATVLASLAPLGCGDSSSASPTQPALSLATGVAPPVLIAMTEALIDEYRAEAAYLSVVEDFGEIRPFTNIVLAERRHASSIEQTFVKRGLSVPANPWSPELIDPFPTVASACEQGVLAEQANIEMYDAFLALELPADVRRVFASNRAASLDNHLPAFERCR